MLCGRPAHVTLSQPTVCKEELLCVATDMETGHDVFATISISSLRERAGSITVDACMRRAVRELERVQQGQPALPANTATDEHDAMQADVVHSLSAAVLRPASTSSTASQSSLPSADALRRKQDQDAIEKCLLVHGRGPHGMVDYIAPEQEAVQPHEFLMENPVFPGMPAPFVADSITDRADVYSFGLVCARECDYSTMYVNAVTAACLKMTGATTGVEFRRRKPTRAFVCLVEPAAL